MTALKEFSCHQIVTWS